MNQKINLLPLFFLLLVDCTDDNTHNNISNGAVQSIITLGGSNNERGESVVATLDGGYAIAGYTQSNNGDISDKVDESFDYWILKFDPDNTIEWDRTFGGSGNDRAIDIIQTLDGGYTVLGSSSSNDGDITENAGQSDFWLIKLNPLGNLIWQKTFGFSGSEQGMSLIQTNDQGYLITGVLDVTSSGGEGNTNRDFQKHAGGDFWAVKADDSGNLEWSRYFGGNFTDTPRGIVQIPDGGYIIAGGSDSSDTDISNNLGSYDYWVIRISATGDLIWEKSFGGSQIDEANAIVPSNDGNFFVVGETRSNDIMVRSNKGAADIWLIKISPSGELIWEKSFGGSSFDSASNISLVSDGLLISGSSRSADGDVSDNKGQNDVWIMKVNFEGNLQWQTSVGGSNIDFGYDLCKLNDGTVVAVGDTNSEDGDIEENNGFTDLIIIELDD
ncbi:MAG: hypothetical protein AAGH46_00515 [Bacteroidota bacterium]